MRGTPIPVIDLFAGPGGLSEGFSAYETSTGHHPFDIKLAIEKDLHAHTTLKLRSFFRQFSNKPQFHGQGPAAYYKVLRDTRRPLQQRLDDLFAQHTNEAKCAEKMAWRIELGKEKPETVWKRINSVLDKADPWVLLGGPPCQAYSLAGRSRNKGKPDPDARQYLYVEYLHIIAEHKPTVFIMENVKGLISATVKNQKILEQILTDLKDPVKAINKSKERSILSSQPDSPETYRIFSLSHGTVDDSTPKNFVVQMEKYGVPQARHRLILLGIRNDVIGSVTPESLEPPDIPDEIPARDVLEGLPCLRSGLSRETDTPEAWLACLREFADRQRFNTPATIADEEVRRQLLKAVNDLTNPLNDRGSEFVKCVPDTRDNREWYLDSKMKGIFNHATRGHMVTDLHRYLYATCFARAKGRSPVLADFPPALRPDHKNVQSALGGSYFADRFRVQLENRPSTTVTSHIAKDGHYYIHYDPQQCRSLTVREAARLQTFPDNYFFCGPRTAQYIQVGNAVPPLLARQIARIVLQVLKDTGAVN